MVHSCSRWTAVVRPAIDPFPEELRLRMPSLMLRTKKSPELSSSFNLELTLFVLSMIYCAWSFSSSARSCEVVTIDCASSNHHPGRCRRAGSHRNPSVDRQTKGLLPGGTLPLFLWADPSKVGTLRRSPAIAVCIAVLTLENGPPKRPSPRLHNTFNWGLPDILTVQLFSNTDSGRYNIGGAGKPCKQGNSPLLAAWNRTTREKALIHSPASQLVAAVVRLRTIDKV